MYLEQWLSQSKNCMGFNIIIYNEELDWNWTIKLIKKGIDLQKCWFIDIYEKYKMMFPICWVINSIEQIFIEQLLHSPWTSKIRFYIRTVPPGRKTLSQA